MELEALQDINSEVKGIGAGRALPGYFVDAVREGTSR
jgi:hypothetical protein